MNTHSEPPSLTEEERETLVQLAKRQRESETLESQIIAKYAGKASMAKSVWTACVSAGTALVLSTIYIMGVDQRVHDNAHRLDKSEGRIDWIVEKVTNLELQMKDKVNRKQYDQ